MEESKELQGFYKIFRAVIYVSILMEFFAYALEPEQLDFLGGRSDGYPHSHQAVDDLP